MRLNDLPRALMAEHLSNPRQEALDKLTSLALPQSILRTYGHVEDIADAFDGAFTAFHVHAHLSRGGDKETWLEEALYWYAVEGHRDPNGPFFSTLRRALTAFDLGNFYTEIENYIIEKKGII
jgi:hypothetical protein